MLRGAAKHLLLVLAGVGVQVGVESHIWPAGHAKQRHLGVRGPLWLLLLLLLLALLHAGGCL